MACSFPLPTKPYLKRYLEFDNIFGPKLIVNQDCPEGKYLVKLIGDPNNEYGYLVREYLVKATLTVMDYIALRVPGTFLTDMHIRDFNRFLEDQVKSHMRNNVQQMLTANEWLEKNRLGKRNRKEHKMGIADAIRMYADQFGFDEVTWPFDSMKQDYYRYQRRIKRNGNKNLTDYQRIKKVLQ